MAYQLIVNITAANGVQVMQSLDIIKEHVARADKCGNFDGSGIDCRWSYSEVIPGLYADKAADNQDLLERKKEQQ